MMPIDRFERQLPMALTDLADPRTPDYLADILGRTARTRQRPAWASFERWLPMDLATKALPGAPRFPWRIAAVLALLAILLAATLALYAGSHRQTPAPPFGRAANGSILFAADGDIFAADPRTGVTTAIVVSPETDIRPVYSLDGTRVVFERKVNGDVGPGWLFVARDDGADLVRVTPEPLVDLAEWNFSPDGRSIVALVAGKDGPAILVVPSDGRGQPVFFDVGATTFDGPPRYRPDGTEIMYIGRERGLDSRGLYSLEPATGDVRTIIAPSPNADIHTAAWSPDGTRIAYAAFDPTVDARSTRTHIVSADGSGGFLLDTHPGSIADGGSVWSNDGTRLIINRFYPGGPDDIARNAIVPIDRSSVGVDIECATDPPPDDCLADWIWSPDDSVLLAAAADANDQPMPMLLADPTTGKIRLAPWTATGNPAWQRVAR